MNNKFLPELTRRLRKEGIATGQLERDRLPVLVDGQQAIAVSANGTVLLNTDAIGDPKVSRVYDAVVEISDEVYEYTAAMASAPRLEAEGLQEGFRLLAEFNGVVLAGREMAQNFGYEFVTWWCSPGHTAVANGNYYHDDYTGAKQDFAIRSGLVQEDRQFTDEQLTELYRCASETLDSGYFVAREREEMLAALMKQIEYCVDDVEERVAFSDQRELEAANRQDRAALGLAF